jgi:uncharacterized LabA/DUF88 family protein
MAADDLRRAADNFLDLVDLTAVIGRPPRERPEGRQEAHYEDEEEYDET